MDIYHNGYSNGILLYIYTLKGIKMKLSSFLKQKRSLSGLTQPDLAAKAGVGLRFIREMEQGKETLRLDKVNQVLNLFGYEMGPVKTEQRLINNEQLK